MQKNLHATHMHSQGSVQQHKFKHNLINNTESYSRGLRGHPAKVLGRATGARVQIPHSPPTKRLILAFFIFYLIVN